MKLYKQFRGEIYQESAFGDFFRLIAQSPARGGKPAGIFPQMVGKLLQPSIHSPSPMISTNPENRRGRVVDRNAVYLRHAQDGTYLRYTGPNAARQAAEHIRKNPQYVYDHYVINSNAILETTALTAAQKLALMGDDKRADTLAALNRLKKVGDVNRLSNRHRTLVTKFLTKTGGLDKVSGAVARQTLSMYRKMSNREDV